jgi:hypothetical protein
MTVLRATRWQTNGHMMADVAKLGYLEGRVLDTTYGKGVFWRNWQPEVLVGCDINPLKAKDLCCDFRHLPFGNQSFDAVVYDPPYQTNGTPSLRRRGEVTGNWTRYGITATWGEDRANLMEDGLVEAARVAKKFLLVKCMNQVVSGHVHWQTYRLVSLMTTRTPLRLWRLEDQFDFLRDPRPQDTRPQRHARGNYSTLLVFRRL